MGKSKRPASEDKPLDPHWTIENDRQSVHVGINTRIWLLKKQGMKPCFIRLGREHTLLFMREKTWLTLPRGPWFYSNARIPVVFNDPKIIGIAVEGAPQKPSKAVCRDSARTP